MTDRFQQDLSDETIRIQNLSISQKVMIKKLMKIDKFFRCLKKHDFQAIKDIHFKYDSTIPRLYSKLCQNCTSISLTLSEIEAVKERQDRTGLVHFKSHV